MTNWNSDLIKEITEPEARAMALEAMQIKGHNVYFVDFGGHFKYSALVYVDGMHIHYADEYELHYTHMNWSRQQMHDKFITHLSAKLFTEDELTGPVLTYDEYKRKLEYLHNYYGMRRERVTIFCINPSKAETEAFEKRTASMTYDKVAFAYYDDPAFVAHHLALYDALTKSWSEHENDYSVLKSMFVYEMANHEYAINWQGNWDVLNATHGARYHEPDWDIDAYFNQLNFTDTQRRAYLDARQEYMRQANDI